jgi:catechol 2,3-dioxygenase-like lactoylglutathione lyase family enzyme
MQTSHRAGTIHWIHHVQLTIPPGSEEEARQFYCQTLSLPEIEKPATLAGRGGLWLQAGDRQVHIGVENGVDRRRTKGHIAYEVTDLPGWKAKLTALGVEVLEGIPIPGYDRFEFRDPFGNRVEFLERQPLTLLPLDGVFAVCRLERDAPIPPWATARHFFSITRTLDELSIVCPEDGVPPDVPCERGWRCMRVAGSLPFSLVGVLASLTAPLADSGISVFAVSTFDTDYLLVKEEAWQMAIAALARHGYVIAN